MRKSAKRQPKNEKRKTNTNWQPSRLNFELCHFNFRQRMRFVSGHRRSGCHSTEPELWAPSSVQCSVLKWKPPETLSLTMRLSFWELRLPAWGATAAAAAASAAIVLWPRHMMMKSWAWPGSFSCAMTLFVPQRQPFCICMCVRMCACLWLPLPLPWPDSEPETETAALAKLHWNDFWMHGSCLACRKTGGLLTTLTAAAAAGASARTTSACVHVRSSCNLWCALPFFSRCRQLPVASFTILPKNFYDSCARVLGLFSAVITLHT